LFCFHGSVEENPAELVVLCNQELKKGARKEARKAGKADAK
jgi:hypothetical protein